MPDPGERRQNAQALAAAAGWTMQTIPGRPFALAAFLPAAPPPSERLTIYLEGDGMAWVTPSRISADPTPRDPLALRLALAQPGGAAAYLGRPCQYVFTTGGCNQALWTSRRFAPEVVTASNEAIDHLKRRFDARELTLVGYSGGGALALLVAARRADVTRVVTVAGNLDHQAWTSLHRINALHGSLNPADNASATQRIRQWHFVGEKDAVIPPQLALDFAGRQTQPAGPTVRIVPGFDHQCCWAEAWPRLWNTLLSTP